MGRQNRMTAQGQVTIPEDVRAMIGLNPGDLVTFERSAGSVRVVRGVEALAPSFEDRMERARALANPLPLGMSTDEYMSWIREPLPPLDQ